MNGAESANGVVAARPTSSAPVTDARPSPSVRRTGGAPRRAPGIAINYGYLRGDIRALAVLAPIMVVLVIVAYAVFH